MTKVIQVYSEPLVSFQDKCMAGPSDHQFPPGHSSLWSASKSNSQTHMFTGPIILLLKARKHAPVCLHSTCYFLIL